MRTYCLILVFTVLAFLQAKVPALTDQLKDINSGFDPICGEEVIWHIHIQDGFDIDSLRFVFQNDTFPPVYNVETGNNGCTEIYFTSYEKDGQTKIFLKNMPDFNLVKKVDSLRLDSFHVGMLIEEKLFDFEESLEFNNFFGINYDSTSKSITYLKSKKCFGCW